MDRTILQPIFVHCHECQIRTNPSGTLVLADGQTHRVPTGHIKRLCAAVLRRLLIKAMFDEVPT
jgi:hypothetical protein